MVRLHEGTYALMPEAGGTYATGNQIAASANSPTPHSRHFLLSPYPRAPAIYLPAAYEDGPKV